MPEDVKLSTISCCAKEFRSHLYQLLIPYGTYQQNQLSLRDDESLSPIIDLMMKASSSVHEDRLQLTPPFRYGRVSRLITRGSYPTLMNFRFLQRLRLHLIISLIPEGPSQDLIDFAKVCGIELIHIQVNISKSRRAFIRIVMLPSSCRRLNKLPL
jgi:hypothetical protein